jgi:hypothetical protein
MGFSFGHKNEPSRAGKAKPYLSKHLNTSLPVYVESAGSRKWKNSMKCFGMPPECTTVGGRGVGGGTGGKRRRAGSEGEGVQGKDRDRERKR